MPRYINFNSTDFSRGIGNWAGHWIIITVFFEGLDASEEAQALAVQSSGHMDTASKGSYSVYFRPKYQFRKELHDYSILTEKDSEGLELLLDKITIADYEVVYLSRGSGDFNDDETYKNSLGILRKSSSLILTKKKN